MAPPRKKTKIIIAVSFALFAALGLAHPLQGSAAEEPVLSIGGLVDNPLNITYGEFARLPMTSVNATCTCVGWPPEDVGVNAYDVYTYNWTGLRVSVLLGMAGYDGDAQDIVFYASDGYSSSLSPGKALDEDTIIAVKADGKPLTHGTGYPFRLVVPCWWGYKWVKYVERIEVVDYDYLGTWESAGFPDEAEIPECGVEKKEDSGWLSPLSIGLAASGTAILGVAAYMVRKNGRG
ncbi:MAG: molybdopterin-dependent oxidoreductase [Candidatus Bathyarchaeota archaeon]|nr:molybdopterin-dependent oxidoreductase [Candidatus Bathyarchaeota archaeon]